MKALSTINLINLHLNHVIYLFNFKTGIKTIEDFVREVENIAKYEFPTVEENEENPANKFKGDMLEILADLFFNIHSADPAVGLINYRSVPIYEDYGVDGIGTNVNGNQVVVQVKYKANPLTKIEYSEVSKTYCAGRESHQLPLDESNTIFVFTTGNGMTQAVKHVLKNKIRIIDRKIISGYIDNNLNLWQQVDGLIMYSLDNASNDS